jgi:deoxyribonuclease-4
MSTLFTNIYNNNNNLSGYPETKSNNNTEMKNSSNIFELEPIDFNNLKLKDSSIDDEPLCNCSKNKEFTSVQQNTMMMRIVNPDRRFGSDFPLLSSVTDTCKAAVQNGLTTVQTYLGNPLDYKRLTINDQDAKTALAYIKEKDLSFYTHTPLKHNLAGQNTFAVVASLNSELKEIRKVEGSSVVHIGAKGSISDVIQSLRRVSFGNRRNNHRMRYPLLLENAAGEGTRLGSTIDELRKLFEPFDLTEGLGLCFDTAHAFAAGITNFQTMEIFDEIDAAIGIDRLQLLHLNDSKIPFGGKSDRHQSLGYGYIWPTLLLEESIEKKESLDDLVKFCTEKKIDMCLETPQPSQDLLFLQKRYDKYL